MRNVQLRKRIEGQRKRAGWNESDNANQTALTTTNGVTQKTKIQYTIHNELRQSHYSIQSRRTFVPSGVCNGSSETRKYCDWNQGKGLCGSRGWEAGACQVSLCCYVVLLLVVMLVVLLVVLSYCNVVLYCEVEYNTEEWHWNTFFNHSSVLYSPSIHPSIHHSNLTYHITSCHHRLQGNAQNLCGRWWM